MLGWLLLALITVPLLELVVLVRLAGTIGLLPTVAVIVATGVVGAVLARTQGVQTLRRLRHRLAAGESPSRELVDGALIVAGAALLLTPGLITDGVGLLLLLPLTRPPIRDALRRRFAAARRSGHVHVEVVDGGPNTGTDTGGDDGAEGKR